MRRRKKTRVFRESSFFSTISFSFFLIPRRRESVYSKIGGMLFPLSFRCCLFFQDLTVKKLPADTILTEVGRGGGACFLLSQKSRNGTEGNVGSGIDSIYYFFPSSPLPHILGRERGTKTLFFLHTHTGQTWIQGERKGGKEIRSLAHLHKETYSWLLWNAKAGQDFFFKRKCYLHVNTKKAGNRGGNHTRFLCT